MALFRRSPADPELSRVKEAFRRLGAELDAAQRALLASVPTARSAGAPLRAALEDFLAGITRAEALMPAWRIDGTVPLWERCTDALADSRAQAERLMDAEENPDFEALNAQLGDVISPLEEFADAAAAIRRLR